MMELSGCIVTIDAMAVKRDCQLLSKMLTILSAKESSSLYKNVEQLFKEAIRTGFQGIEHSVITQQSKLTGGKKFA